ncbi:MAG: hypothetical protein JW891_00210 [Candidatus Lokiarchaeota archaeon]|nr:hypothetical protein [Candidatus Lokiarchaeota archaeon]
MYNLFFSRSISCSRSLEMALTMAIPVLRSMTDSNFWSGRQGKILIPSRG